jgi:hypothetical protein
MRTEGMLDSISWFWRRGKRKLFPVVKTRNDRGKTWSFNGFKESQKILKSQTEHCLMNNEP